VQVRTLDEGRNLRVLVGGSTLLDQVDLVLENQNVLQLHDFDGSQVLGGLWLRARLVAGDQQQRGVHDRGAVEHGGHQDVVAGAVDERHVTATSWVASVCTAGDGD